MSPSDRAGAAIYALALIGLPIGLALLGMAVWEAILIPWGGAAVAFGVMPVMDALARADARWLARRSGEKEKR